MPRTNRWTWTWLFGLLALLALGGCDAMSGPPRRVDVSSQVSVDNGTPMPVNVSVTFGGTAVATPVPAAGGSAPSATVVPPTRVPPTAGPASPMPTATVYPGYCVCRDPDGDGIDNISGARDPNRPQATPAPAGTTRAGQPVATVAPPTSVPPTSAPTMAAQQPCPWETTGWWSLEDDFPTEKPFVGDPTWPTYGQFHADGDNDTTTHIAIAGGLQLNLPVNWVGTIYNTCGMNEGFVARWNDMRAEVQKRDSLSFLPPLIIIDSLNDPDMSLLPAGITVTAFSGSPTQQLPTDPFATEVFQVGANSDIPMGDAKLFTYFEAHPYGRSDITVKVLVHPGMVVRIPALWEGTKNHQPDAGTPADDVLIIDGENAADCQILEGYHFVCQPFPQF